MIVLEHINTLLCSADAEARRRANDFLMKWQQSIEAWAEAHAIIEGGFPLEAKFIAAQTLRAKMMYDFYQLPLESIGKLGEILMAYLSNTSFPKNITSMISLAICDLAMQAAEVWESPLESFISCYENGTVTLKTLLTLIECLADESRNSRVIVTPDVRKKFTDSMKRDYYKLLDLLVKLRASGSDVKTSSDIFRCWYSWRQLDNFVSTSEASGIFINDCLEIIKRPKALGDQSIDSETYEAAVDCMIDVLQEVKYLTNRILSEEESSSQSVDYFKQAKQDLQPIVKACFDLCSSEELTYFLIEAFGNQDRFLLECFSRILSALIDALDFNLLEPPAQLLRLLQLEIQFIEAPYCMVFQGFKTGDQPGTINCFSRYYNRMEIRERTLDAVATCGPADFTPIDEDTAIYAQYGVSVISNVLHAESPNCQRAKEIAMQLLEIILLISTSPPVSGDHDNDDYENYLDDVYDVIPKVTKILNAEFVFDYVKKLTIEHGKFASSLQGLESSFKSFGSCLSCLDVRKLSSQQVQVVYSIIEGIEKLLGGKMPSSSVELNCWEAAIMFIRHSVRVIMLDDTEIIAQKVTALLCGVYLVSLSDGTPYATKVERILVTCIASVCYHIKLGKLRNWEPILRNLALCLQRAGPNNKYLLTLIDGTSRAISDLEPNTLRSIVEELSKGWVKQLEAVARMEIAMQPVDLCKFVGNICSLVRNVKKRNILHKFVQDVLTPLLCRLMEIYYNDENTVEDIGRCLKHAARSIGNDFAGCVPQVVATVENVAKQRMWSTYLYLVEWLYMLITPEHAAVKQLYSVLTRITLNILANGSLQCSMNEELEQLIDDFFGLQTRFIRNSPDCFDDVTAFREIVGASVMCFNIRQPFCVFEFWIAFMESDIVFPKFKHVATEFLPKCVSEIFTVLGSGCQGTVEHCVEDFVDSLFYVMGTEAAMWLQMGFDKLPVSVVPNDRKRCQIFEGLVSENRKETIYQIHKLCCQVAMRNRAF
ncbi:transportin 3 and importin 13 like protein [Babesia gibsoni]|uniref:Transportin 3 and importin 13 like protein n=1 Tax=Babesia gibsoni TaxID=33632 RepID=A0AAD8LLA9_BABGI|nr:transportin 3 and importin 13 like protein [Babesia gibsoni]